MTHRKGKDGENEVCQFLREVEGVEAERNLNERRSGNTGDLSTNLPLEFQVKAKKQPSVWKAVEEAEEAVERASENGRPGRYGVAVLKRKNGRGVPADRRVAMTWETFRDIVRELVGDDVW